jgi:hypothetical protein
MNEVQQPAERPRQWLFRGITGLSDCLFEHALDAKTRERRARGKNALFRIANQDGRERAERHSVWLEHAAARLQSEHEAIAPFFTNIKYD